jgi:hypothetical protein
MRPTLRALSIALLTLPFHSAPTAAETASDISIQNAYARAVPPGQPNSAAFMTITNDGEQERDLVAAASDVAEVVELHTHTMDDGVMRMRQIERIALPAGETVTLEPGGLHVMLIGLTRDLKAGDSLTLTLGFDDGSEQSLTLPVKQIMAGHGAMSGHKMPSSAAGASSEGH